MTENVSVIPTRDGSNTFLNIATGQAYHSMNGALQEATHVFLKSGVIDYLDTSELSNISILEVGFGSGLNFLITADYCIQRGVSLEYNALEPYPISPELFYQSRYSDFLKNTFIWDTLTGFYSEILRTHQTLHITKNIKLRINQSQLIQYQSAVGYDLIFYDAFSPASQPEMWTLNSIGLITSMLKQGGRFVTYSITGNLKRALKTLGFTVEKLPGAAGKREMLRASKKLTLEHISNDTSSNCF